MICVIIIQQQIKYANRWGHIFLRSEWAIRIRDEEDEAN